MKTNVAATLLVILAGLSTSAFAQLAQDAAVAKAELEIPEAKLKPAWSGMLAQFGAFKGIEERREGQMDGRQAVELILAFEKDTIVQRVVFDPEGKIAGLVFRPKSMAVLPPNKTP